MSFSFFMHSVSTLFHCCICLMLQRPLRRGVLNWRNLACTLCRSERPGLISPSLQTRVGMLLHSTCAPDAAEEVHRNRIQGVVNPQAPQQLRAGDHEQSSNPTNDNGAIVLYDCTG